MTAPVLLVDTASLYFRAFHALPRTITDSDGAPINALHGLVGFLASLEERYSPSAIVCARDAAWRPRWRVELVPSYKAHRIAHDNASHSAGDVDVEDVPAELAHQVPIIWRVLDELGLTTVGVPDYEADDVLATLATHHPGRSLVVTGDRDLFQLAHHQTQVAYVARGIAAHELVDDQWVVATTGVHASQYVDYAVLRGDPSDGLPGVKGIGAATAARLIAKFGSLEGIVAAVHDPGSTITPTVRRNLLAASTYLPAAQRVVRAVTDLSLDVATITRPVPAPAREVIESLERRYGVRGPIERLLAHWPSV